MEPDLQLVTVLETRDTFGLSLAKASLDEAGIDYWVSGGDIQYTPYGAYGVGTSLCQIQVAPECESEARSLLEPLQNPDPMKTDD